MFFVSDKLLMKMFWPNFIGAAEDFDSCSCSCCQATERTVQEQERSEDGLPPGFQKKKTAMGDSSSWRWVLHDGARKRERLKEKLVVIDL